MKKIIIAFSFLFLFSSNSIADIWYVPSQCPTIQAALDSCSIGDTVLVASGTYYENILWPATQSILLKSESGAALTIIDGGSISNVIAIITGVNNTTIIDGFTIKNGYDGAGGGIGIRYSSPTIRNNLITQNIAYETPSNNGGGGGIAVGYNSSPIIVDNIFTYNSATASGGGGFLCGFNSHPIIDNNTFENNSAATGGGAILIHNDCSATITNNLIRYNNSNIHGGGIYFQQANSTVQNNTIEYNTADRSGGGIGAGWPDISLVDNNIIRYNLAHEGGGGIALLQDAMSTLSNNDIYNNIADSTGGGIFCHDNSNGQILNNVLKHNEANYGGGIHCYQHSNPLITDNTIDSNKAFLSGGGIRCKSYSSPQILDNTITYNVAEDSLGGGISCVEYSSPEIRYNTVRHNEAQLAGGGIVCYNNSSPAIKYNSIDSNNVMSGYGGGIFCGENSSPDIVDNGFNSNSCSLLGGDIFAWWGCTVIIDSNEIHGSQSLSSLFLVGTSSIVRYNSITNHAGCGVRLWADFSNIHNNEIAGNDTGVVCVVGSNPTINYNNMCGNNHYGVYNHDPSVTVNALYNWWGDPTGPYHPVLNPGGQCNPVSDYVLFDPWIIPVELTSFTAVGIAGEVILNWTTATEVNNLGFEIERRIINNEAQGDWTLIGFSEGHGTTTESKEYSYTDNINGINATSFAYRLKQIDYNGNYEYSDEVFIDNLAPVDFVLEQNYPNPFNPSTTISYSVPVKTYINLTVFNSLSKEVMTLVNEEQAPGTYQVVFNAINLASGVYFYQLKTDSYCAVKKLMLLK